MVKAKVRFDGLDVTAMVAELNRSLLGRRVINIYHEGNDCYIIKLDGTGNSNSNTGTATSDNKSLLLLESGVRFHSTQHPPSTATGTLPPPFCSKLRKHLRGLRLERIAQLGLADRVVHFLFGSGEQKHSLILELYARGNLILTSGNYEILALLRSHEFDAKDNNNDDTKVKVKVGHVYPVTYATSWGNQTQTDVATAATTDDSAETQPQPHPNNDLLHAKDGAEALAWAKTEMPVTPAQTTPPLPQQGKSKKDGSQNTTTLKALLLKAASGVSHFGPSLLEHCILTADLNPNQPMTLANMEEKMPVESWEKLIVALREQGSQLMDSLQGTTDSKTNGYILYQPKKTSGENGTADTSSAIVASLVDHADKILEEFQPHLLKQHLGRPVLEYGTFSEAVDDFFFHLEGQKRALRAEAAEAAARDKLEKVRRDQEQRVEALEREQERLKEHAEIVKLHADDVDKALSVINSALDNGMDWEQLEQLVKVEQENQNPIALLIHKLDLEHDAMILKLPEDIGGDETTKIVEVTVLLKESAHGNARRLFAQYRSSKEKAHKTVEASTKALKAAEETANRQLAEAQKRTKQTVASLAKRKSLWFEKFHWFITSDNYLVLGGRDAQQNEQLVKRYLRPGDAYLHADVHGAASCILRAKRRRTKRGKTHVVPLSDQALREAGSFTICRSSAWASKIVTSAWWVESHQVSKTAPTGEYLTVGSFMVRGKKNFLPPTQLEMGLAVLFRLGDDDSIARHRNERRDFALMELEQNDEEEEEVEEEQVSKPDGPTSDILPSSTEKTTPSIHADDSGNFKPEATVEVNATIPDESKTKEPPTVSDDETPDQQVQPPVQSIETTSNQSEISDENDEDNETGVDTKSAKKKGLSARERRLIKKYGSLEAAAQVTVNGEANNDDDDTVRDLESTVNESVATQATKRGKKAKMKKMARKYADQDEEERKFAMLANQGGEKLKKSERRPQPVANETQQKAAAETAAFLVKDSKKVADDLPDSVRELLIKSVANGDINNSTSETFDGWSKLDADVLEQLVTLNVEAAQLAVAKRLLTLTQQANVQNYSSSLAGILRTVRKYGYENIEKQNQETSETASQPKKMGNEVKNDSWKQVLAEEGIDDEEVDDDAIDDTIEISKLTGKPQPEDSILFAVAVCAPYNTVSQYAFRVKLTPGNLKRGKAAKQCVEMLLKPEGDKTATNDRYRDLIKKVGDNDWVQAICSDVKISAPGASKVAKSAKSTNAKSSQKNKKK